MTNKTDFTLNIDLKPEKLQSFEMLTDANKSKEIFKQYDQIQLSEKLLISLINTNKDTITKQNEPNEQIETITSSDFISNEKSVELIPAVEKETCPEVSQKEELKQSIGKVTSKKQKKKNEEKEKISENIIEDEQPSSELSSQVLQENINKDNNKSYASITAASSSHRSSPQLLNQEEIILDKPVPLKNEIQLDKSPANDITNINVDNLTSEKEIDKDEIKNVDNLSSNEMDSPKTQVQTNDSQIEMTSSWAEEIEKEIYSPVISQSSENIEPTILIPTSEDVELSSSDLLDSEIISKTETDSWAAIVAKRKTKDTLATSLFIEQETMKIDKVPDKEEQHLPSQVQIFVEESPPTAPIEDLLLIDDQGFVEVVNRKELRSRRSRSRSRNNRPNDLETETVDTNQIESDIIHSDSKSMTTIVQDNDTKSEIQKQKGKGKSQSKGVDKEIIEKQDDKFDKDQMKGTIIKGKTLEIITDGKKQEHVKDGSGKCESKKQKTKSNTKSKDHKVEIKENGNKKLEEVSSKKDIRKEINVMEDTDNIIKESLLDNKTELNDDTNKEEMTNNKSEIIPTKTVILDQESTDEPVDNGKSKKLKTADKRGNNSLEIRVTEETSKEHDNNLEKNIISDQESKDLIEKDKGKSKKQRSKKNKSRKNELKKSIEQNEDKPFKMDEVSTENVQIIEKEKSTTITTERSFDQVKEIIDTTKDENIEKIKDQQDSKTTKKEKDEQQPVIGKSKNKSKNKRTMQDKSKGNINKDKEDNKDAEKLRKDNEIITDKTDINVKFIEEEKLDTRVDTNDEKMYKENENNENDSKSILAETNGKEISTVKKQMDKTCEQSEIGSTIESVINEQFIAKEKPKISSNKSEVDGQPLKENDRSMKSATDSTEIKKPIVDKKIQQKSRKEDKKKKKQAVKNLLEDNLSNKETEKKENEAIEENKMKFASIKSQKLISDNVDNETVDKCVEKKTEQEQITPETIVLDSSGSSNVKEVTLDKTEKEQNNITPEKVILDPSSSSDVKEVTVDKTKEEQNNITPEKVILDPSGSSDVKEVTLDKTKEEQNNITPEKVILDPSRSSNVKEVTVDKTKEEQISITPETIILDSSGSSDVKEVTVDKTKEEQNNITPETVILESSHPSNVVEVTLDKTEEEQISITPETVILEPSRSSNVEEVTLDKTKEEQISITPETIMLDSSHPSNVVVEVTLDKTDKEQNNITPEMVVLDPSSSSDVKEVIEDKTKEEQISITPETIILDSSRPSNVVVEVTLEKTEKKEISITPETVILDSSRSSNVEEINADKLDTSSNEKISTDIITSQDNIISKSNECIIIEDKTDVKENIEPVDDEYKTKTKEIEEKVSSEIKSHPDHIKIEDIEQLNDIENDESIESDDSSLLSMENRPKVRFYIADDVLILTQDKEKELKSAMIQERTLNTVRSKFLSLDGGFWPTKHPYHEAEKSLFESLAHNNEKNSIRDNKNDSDRDPPDHGYDDGNNGGGSKGGSGRCFDNSRSLLGSPRTECLVTDLPGGICSWRDYSTYLSSENEERLDNNNSLQQLTHKMTENLITEPSLLHSMASSSPPPPQPPTSTNLLQLTSESQTNSNHPIRTNNDDDDDDDDDSSDNKLIPPDHSNVSTNILLVNEEKLTPTSVPLNDDQEFVQFDLESCSPISTSIPSHPPLPPTQDIGRSTLDYLQQWTTNEQVERETRANEDKTLMRIQGIKDTIEERLAILKNAISDLEATNLPRDSIQSMLSATEVMIKELENYEEEAVELQRQLNEIPFDATCQIYTNTLESIQSQINTLLIQTKQSNELLKQALDIQLQRTTEINEYLMFLEETDAWLKDIVIKINDQLPMDQNLQAQLLDRSQRVSELESLPEVKDLANVLKNELMDMINRLQQKQQELLDEEAMADDETTDRDDATIDQAPSIHSTTIESGPPSLADVSLQTGQSLLLDIIEDKPIQLTKQTSTIQIPITTSTQSLTTQTIDTTTYPDQQIKETIKVVKLSEGDHDVIEIATKNARATDISQSLIRSEQSNIVPDDIIVDMKYQDGQKEDNAKSELNIHHATPQSFETVLTEPDNVTTEVVVDADGTKRIIVRKLRHTVVTNRSTEQQHASSITTALGKDASRMQAFSEATLRDQYVTVTTTKPDGTVETLTKQIHGSKVTTGIPDAEYFEEKYETTPQYTHKITQGAIRDISPLPIEEQILEHGQYQTKTSSVHAVVQQVTRRVIKKTRRIIRKVTIIDGKETTSEEIIEEPDEIEIDEQDIPHININVVKNESERTFGLEQKVTDERKQEPSLFSGLSGNIQSSTTYEQHCPDSPMQGPFFGPFAKDMSSIRRSEVKKKPIVESTIVDDTKVDAGKIHDESKETDKVEIIHSTSNNDNTNEQPITIVQEQDILTCTVTDIQPESVIDDIHSPREIISEVNNTGEMFPKEQVTSYLEESIILQTPDEDMPAVIQSPVSSEDPAKTDNASVTTEATCKSDDAPISNITLGTLLESSTVEVAKHDDDSNILDPDNETSRTSIYMLEDQQDARKIQEQVLPTMENKLEDNNVEQLQKQLADIQPDVKSKETASLETMKITQTVDKDISKPQDEKEQIERFLVKEREGISKDDIFLSEEKPVAGGKVEISLSIQKHDEKPESMVYVKTQSERSNERPYHTVLEDVKINLPADQEASEVVHNKTVQTSPLCDVQKDTATTQTSIPSVTETSQQESVLNDQLNVQDNKDNKMQEELHQLQQDAGTISPVSTTIAESIEISIPISESPEHISEQAQPDIVEITDSLGLSSNNKNDSFGYDHGYEPDDRTTVEEQQPSSVQADDINRKKKKKKRKKQKSREIIEDSSGIIKHSSDEDDDSTNKLIISDKEDNTNKETNKEIEDIETKSVIEEPIINIDKIPIDTQTVAIETCNVSISPEQSKELASIGSVIDTVEQEMQTFKVEETDSHMQTSPKSMFESGVQTVQEEIPKIKESSIQTVTPTKIQMTEDAIQTSPIEDVTSSPILLETKDSYVQTIVEMDSAEMQTSPIECIPSIDMETQTLSKVSIEAEQQTTPPATIEQTTSPDQFEIVEVNAQMNEPPAPKKPEMLDFDVQTELSDKAILETTETQTIPIEPIQQQMETQETEVQTNKSPEIRSLETMETQTTPEESLNKIETEEREIQVKSFQLFPLDSIETQTTPAQSPRKVEIMEKEVQAQLMNITYPETVETQTTPKDSPKKIEVLEREVQTKSLSPINNIMTQTSPVTSLQPAQTYDLETQTTPKSEGMEIETQTSTPERVETISSSMQVETKELIPHLDKTSQISAESYEKSSQVSPKLQETLDESIRGTIEDQLIETTASVVKSSDTETQSNELSIVEVTESLLQSEISDAKYTESPKPDTKVSEETMLLQIKDKDMEISKEEIEDITLEKEQENEQEKEQEKEKEEEEEEEEDISESKKSVDKSLVKSSTPDTSFEVHIKATIELSSSETSGEAGINVESPTDTSQEVSLTTPSTNDNNETKREKRQKRKRKHKSMEIQLPIKDTTNLNSIFGQPAESQSSSLKLSYSDVAKKNASKQQLAVNIDETNVPQNYGEIVDETITKSSTSSSSSSVPLNFDEEVKKNVQETILIPLDTDTSPVSESTILTNISKPSKSNKSLESPLAREDQRFETLYVSTPSEPMDTTMSPGESPSSTNQLEKSDKPEKTQVKTYAEAISQLLKTSSVPNTVEYEKEYETASSSAWEDRLLVPHSTNSQKGSNIHADFSLREAMEGRIPQHQPTQKTQTTRIISDRVKSLNNAAEMDHLGNVLHVARLSEVTTDKSAEERSLNVRQELTQLRNAIEENDVVIVEETLLTVIETISTWLETIEYRIFLNRECPSGLSHNDAKTFIELKEEVDHVAENIRELDDMWKLVEVNYPIEERAVLRECFDALEQHAKAVEHVTNTSEECANNHLAKWDELLNGINNIYRLVEEQRKQLDNIIECEASTRWKLQELDKMENMNRCHMWKTGKLLATSHELLRDYPGKIIPEETYLAHEITKIIENGITIERDRLLQLLALAEEYEQTLQEFSQIIEIAENLLQSPISVMNLEHLQEEMQKHRKFFVNLNHCRAILESLEGNLDPETRAKHSDLHVELHSRASSLLDQAASRAQQMALAATRWILLEQGVKEERGWLQVAHQRVPDLQTVNSSDYDQYISLYQSLSSDVAMHHARIIQLLDVANRLEELVTIENSEDHYNEVLDEIVKLRDNIESSLRRLLSFRENWSTQQTLINRIEGWMTTAEKELVPLSNTSSGNMRRFWELKAQYEIHNNMRNEADKCFDQALKIIPLSDEILQRQLNSELQYRWKDVTEKINDIQSEITRNISSEDVSSNERLKILERELNELRMCLDDLHGVLKTEEELDLYIERLTVLFDRVTLIQDKLSRLGLLPAAESETVGILLSSAHRIEGQIGEELDSAQLLRDKLQALKRGLGRVRKSHQKHSMTLDQCEESEKQGSDVVSAAVDRCESVADELIVLWHDLMGLRQMLHKLPSGMRVSVSPVGIERDISALQDAHTELESRCTRLLSLLRNRLALWNRFEKHLEMVQQSVQEADYMMELLTVQGSVDYDRLLKATERLEGLNGDFGAREVLISELHASAEPLRESCAAEVRERVEAAVNEAVRAWEDTKAELDALCTKYQHACNLWQQYRDSSAAVKAWVDTQMGSVANLPPEEAIKQVKICEETLAEHKERLAELRDLVAQIASDVGLDAGGPLHCEVEALGRRLEDVRETLSTLADTADVRVFNQELTHVDLCQTKNFLDTVQQSLTTVGQEESNEHLKLLRNHLLALTRTEPQLQSIKDRTVTMSTQEPSVVEVLQQWQRVFKETFQHYHRLSARLFKSQDVIAVLKLWQEHLTYVQEFLSNRVPGDYNGLSEHRNLCEVYRNLLTDQQNHLLTIHGKEDNKDNLNVTEQFNVLTNLHNETLAKIIERHTAVHDRLLAWDNYRRDQNDLFAWLKDIERERSRLQLRFIHLHRLDKILQRIQTLLEKIPIGEAQIESLQKQQVPLLVDCDETLAVSVRMEHAANVERIANLRAGLETWRDFVERVRKHHEQHVAQTEKITDILQDIGQILNSVLQSIPGKLSQTKDNLLFLQKLKTRLAKNSNELESLNVLTKQLRECLSPSDMKSLNQHVALLWQQQGDLDHQLALVEYKLGERCDLHKRWINRQSRLLTWIEDEEIRVKNWDMAPIGEPEELVKRFECELQAEIALKQREYEWVLKTGQQLIDATENSEKAKVQADLDLVNEKWYKLLNSGKVRANILLDLIQSIKNLEKKLIEQRSWMTSIEAQLSENFIIETISQSCIDKKLEDHEYIQKAIQTEGAKIGEILNLCEMLLYDSDTWKASLNTDTIKNGMESLERRWKTTCVRSAERKQDIILAWKLLREMDNIRTEHEGWITQTEIQLTNFEKEMNEIAKKDTGEMLDGLNVIMKDIEAHEPALKILEQNFGRLAKTRLEPENLKSLTGETRKIIDRWLQLSVRTNSIISAIEREQMDYHEFSLAHGAALVGLTQIDIRLTQLQHLLTPEQRSSPRSRLQRLSEIEKELNAQNVLLQKADKLALEIMQESHQDDVASIQELVDEYQSLWKEIKTRVANLRTELESQEKSEVDEAVQVETLKFEQDTAVQVNTLPRLIRMTSCDAYMLELKTALTECHHSLDTLETTITPEPVSGPGLNTTAKTIAKMIGCCQSSIELVRHLHALLMEDTKFNIETTISDEVQTVISRYEALLLLARTREQQIRELRSPITDAYSFPCNHDSGRLTCPLCSRRNWTQLDNDLWRLEKWLEFAEGTQSEQNSPPSNIEDLEYVIQEHREFLQHLDSHKSIVVSLNIVGSHLAEHTEDTSRATELRDRLTIANTRWDKVCASAEKWQEQLRRALISNHQFHRIIEELFAWIEKIEIAIRTSEPIDLSEATDILETKYNKFRELRSDLEHCEPRVLSLQESADQLLNEQGGMRARLQELRLRLQSLRRLTGIYSLKLGAALGLDPRDIGLVATTSSLATLSRDLLDEAASGTSQPHTTAATDGDERRQIVSRRGSSFLGRVLRISLPIQALMLLLLGVTSLIPSTEEDYNCMLSNNLARSFTLMVYHPNGPPPL
ncbi:nuclear anchorage protein 1-like isoform X2 [Polistes fuscatus]|uniref:nuclear anchorage protein 1-like isoform X2 n=1 Tax=Polistes fuscatus TaxID=30207 RepID=UPI001CA9C550|nr:nuclear anchorage protein 1-like isoform X2 [Polistes fuscatus]